MATLNPESYTTHMNPIITEPVFEVLPPEVSAAASALSVPESKVAALFVPFQKPLENAALLLAEEEKATTSAEARALRLKMVKARTAIGATKDESKSDIKLAGNIIDWFHNKGRDSLTAAEGRLREIEEAEERAEKARRAALQQERSEQLAAFGVDGKFYNLGEMPDEGYAQLLDSSRAAHIARKEAEAKAEEEARKAAAEAARVAAERAEAERVERERIAAENARLKAEAEAREAELAKEREAAEAERKKIEAAAAKAKAKADAELAKERAAAKEAQEKAAAIEAQAKAEREAEVARVKEEARAKAKAARAPDKDKLIAWAAKIRETPVFTLKSPEAAAIGVEINSRVSKLAEWIEKQAEAL